LLAENSVIRNDLHVHSLQSACGLHTLLEIVEIAAAKGMEMVNVSDHGPALGRPLNLGVFLNHERLPSDIKASSGRSLRLLRGVEANVLNNRGDTDIPVSHVARFDLITLGFHPCGDLPRNGSESHNTEALASVLARYPVDMLAHPCIATFPLHLPTVVDLSSEYGFALEINNTKLRLNKSDRAKLARMVTLAVDKGAPLVETSDGHTFHEIGENEQVERLLADLCLDGNTILVNRDDARLVQFFADRKARRQNWHA
jgi:putative hydrolase